jgi:hypothetical protein
MKVRQGKPSLQNSPQVWAQCGFVTGSLEGRALRPRVIEAGDAGEGIRQA